MFARALQKWRFALINWGYDLHSTDLDSDFAWRLRLLVEALPFFVLALKGLHELLVVRAPASDRPGDRGRGRFRGSSWLIRREPLTRLSGLRGVTVPVCQCSQRAARISDLWERTCSGQNLQIESKSRLRTYDSYEKWSYTTYCYRRTMI